MTPAQLAVIADQMEAKAGVINSRNSTPAGRWNRIALAAESLAGAATLANDNEAGWALRAAKALESFGDVTPGNYNANEEGAVARLLTALQTINGATYTGSLDYRLQLATTAFDPYVTAADNLFTRITASSAKTAARKKLINNCIKSLQSVGLWDLGDAIVFPAGLDSQSSLLNWKSANFNPTLIGVPTFTADRGFTPDGVATALNTNWIPSASALFLQDNGCMAAWVNAGTDVINANKSSIGCVDGTSGVFITPRGTGDVTRGRVNGSATQNYGASATIKGLTSLSRTTAALTTSFKNGVSTGTNTAASTGRCGVAAAIGAFNNNGTLANFSDFRVPFYFLGNCPEVLQDDLYSIVNTYLTAIGAN